MKNFKEIRKILKNQNLTLKIKTVSIYRIKVKTLATNKAFLTGNGINFPIFVSKESRETIQYYLIDSNWEKTNNSKIPIFAHLQISKASGRVKIITFQPEHWNLNIDIDDFIQEILYLLSHFSSSTE